MIDVGARLNPDGTVVPTTIYSSPSSFGLTGAFFHLWLAERGDLYPPLTTQTGPPYLPLPPGVPPGLGTGAVLKGEFRLVTLSSRTGAVTTTENPSFLDSSGNYSPNNPYVQAQQGVQGGSQ